MQSTNLPNRLRANSVDSSDGYQQQRHLRRATSEPILAYSANQLPQGVIIHRGNFSKTETLLGSEIHSGIVFSPSSDAQHAELNKILTDLSAIASGLYISEYFGNTEIRIIEKVEDVIGKLIPANFNLSNAQLEGINKIKLILAEISKIKSNATLKVGFDKKIDSILKHIDLVLRYSASEDLHEKQSLKITIREVFRNKILAPKINWQLVDSNPFCHPEYLDFREGFSPHLTTTEINQLWKKIIYGTTYIKNRIKNGLSYKNNPYFEDVANFLDGKKLLSSDQGKKSALWSGGYDVSLFARKRGYATLENTPAGKVFDNLVLCDNWKPLGQLWNHLSEKYVHNVDKEVHVFFRVHDPMSVLERKEIFTLMKIDGVNLIFHPLFNTGVADDLLKMEEVPIAKNITKKTHIALKNFLVEVCRSAAAMHGNDPSYQRNLRAIQSMKLD